MIDPVPAISPCPACGAPSTEPAFAARDWALRAAPGEFAYRRCRACRSVFADPQPDETVLASAYSTTYANYREERSIVERLAEPLAEREARRVVRSANHEGELLDLGCGTGRFLERLRRVGWPGPLSGAEYSAATARDASVRLGIPIREGTAETFDVPAGSLSAVAMRHVIEHLRDPAAVLDRVHRALRPGGLLYVATPDARALSASVFGRWWWGWEVPRHLVVFSSEALRRTVERHGFRIADEWWAFAPQMWNASLLLLLDRGRGRRWPYLVANMLDPLATGPAVILAGAEVALRRSTMYGLLAHRA